MNRRHLNVFMLLCILELAAGCANRPNVSAVEATPRDIAPDGKTLRFATVANVSGKHVDLIARALPAFNATGMNISEFRVKILAEGESYAVVFEHVKAHLSDRGSAPDAPVFEVELDGQTKEIIRSNLAR